MVEFLERAFLSPSMQISGPGTGDRWFHDRVDSQRREIYHLGHVRK